MFQDIILRLKTDKQQFDKDIQQINKQLQIIENLNIKLDLTPAQLNELSSTIQKKLKSISSLDLNVKLGDSLRQQVESQLKGIELDFRAATLDFTQQLKGVLTDVLGRQKTGQKTQKVEIDNQPKFQQNDARVGGTRQSINMLSSEIFNQRLNEVGVHLTRIESQLSKIAGALGGDTSIEVIYAPPKDSGQAKDTQIAADRTPRTPLSPENLKQPDFSKVDITAFSKAVNSQLLKIVDFADNLKAATKSGSIGLTDKDFKTQIKNLESVIDKLDKRKRQTPALEELKDQLKAVKRSALTLDPTQAVAPKGLSKELTKSFNSLIKFLGKRKDGSDRKPPATTVTRHLATVNQLLDSEIDSFTKELVEALGLMLKNVATGAKARDRVEVQPEPVVPETPQKPRRDKDKEKETKPASKKETKKESKPTGYRESQVASLQNFAESIKGKKLKDVDSALLKKQLVNLEQAIRGLETKQASEGLTPDETGILKAFEALKNQLTDFSIFNAAPPRQLDDRDQQQQFRNLRKYVQERQRATTPAQASTVVNYEEFIKSLKKLDLDEVNKIIVQKFERLLANEQVDRKAYKDKQASSAPKKTQKIAQAEAKIQDFKTLQKKGTFNDLKAALKGLESSLKQLETGRKTEETRALIKTINKLKEEFVISKKNLEAAASPRSISSANQKIFTKAANYIKSTKQEGSRPIASKVRSHAENLQALVPESLDPINRAILQAQIKYLTDLADAIEAQPKRKRKTSKPEEEVKVTPQERQATTDSQLNDFEKAIAKFINALEKSQPSSPLKRQKKNVILGKEAQRQKAQALGNEQLETQTTLSFIQSVFDTFVADLDIKDPLAQLAEEVTESFKDLESIEVGGLNKLETDLVEFVDNIRHVVNTVLGIPVVLPEQPLPVKRAFYENKAGRLSPGTKGTAQIDKQTKQQHITLRPDFYDQLAKGVVTLTGLKLLTHEVVHSIQRLAKLQGSTYKFADTTEDPKVQAELDKFLQHYYKNAPASHIPYEKDAFLRQEQLAPTVQKALGVKLTDQTKLEERENLIPYLKDQISHLKLVAHFLSDGSEQGKLNAKNLKGFESYLTKIQNSAEKLRAEGQGQPTQKADPLAQGIEQFIKNVQQLVGKELGSKADVSQHPLNYTRTFYKNLKGELRPQTQGLLRHNNRTGSQKLFLRPDIADKINSGNIDLNSLEVVIHELVHSFQRMADFQGLDYEYKTKSDDPKTQSELQRFLQAYQGKSDKEIKLEIDAFLRQKELAPIIQKALGIDLKPETKLEKAEKLLPYLKEASQKIIQALGKGNLNPDARQSLMNDAKVLMEAISGQKKEVSKLQKEDKAKEYFKDRLNPSQESFDDLESLEELINNANPSKISEEELTDFVKAAQKIVAQELNFTGDLSQDNLKAKKEFIVEDGELLSFVRAEAAFNHKTKDSTVTIRPDLADALKEATIPIGALITLGHELVHSIQHLSFDQRASYANKAKPPTDPYEKEALSNKLLYYPKQQRNVEAEAYILQYEMADSIAKALGLQTYVDTEADEDDNLAVYLKKILIEIKNQAETATTEEEKEELAKTITSVEDSLDNTIKDARDARFREKFTTEVRGKTDEEFEKYAQEAEAEFDAESMPFADLPEYFAKMSVIDKERRIRKDIAQEREQEKEFKERRQRLYGDQKEEKVVQGEKRQPPSDTEETRNIFDTLAKGAKAFFDTLDTGAQAVISLFTEAEEEEEEEPEDSEPPIPPTPPQPPKKVTGGNDDDDDDDDEKDKKEPETPKETPPSAEPVRPTPLSETLPSDVTPAPEVQIPSPWDDDDDDGKEEKTQQPQTQQRPTEYVIPVERGASVAELRKEFSKKSLAELKEELAKLDLVAQNSTLEERQSAAQRKIPLYNFIKELEELSRPKPEKEEPKPEALKVDTSEEKIKPVSQGEPIAKVLPLTKKNVEELYLMEGGETKTFEGSRKKPDRDIPNIWSGATSELKTVTFASPDPNFKYQEQFIQKPPEVDDKYRKEDKYVRRKSNIKVLDPEELQTQARRRKHQDVATSTSIYQEIFKKIIDFFPEEELGRLAGRFEVLNQVMSYLADHEIDFNELDLVIKSLIGSHEVAKKAAQELIIDKAGIVDPSAVKYDTSRGSLGESARGFIRETAEKQKVIQFQSGVKGRQKTQAKVQRQDAKESLEEIKGKRDKAQAIVDSLSTQINNAKGRKKQILEEKYVVAKDRRDELSEQYNKRFKDASDAKRTASTNQVSNAFEKFLYSVINKYQQVVERLKDPAQRSTAETQVLTESLFRDLEELGLRGKELKAGEKRKLDSDAFNFAFSTDVVGKEIQKLLSKIPAGERKVDDPILNQEKEFYRDQIKAKEFARKQKEEAAKAAERKKIYDSDVMKSRGYSDPYNPQKALPPVSSAIVRASDVESAKYAAKGKPVGEIPKSSALVPTNMTPQYVEKLLKPVEFKVFYNPQEEAQKAEEEKARKVSEEEYFKKQAEIKQKRLKEEQQAKEEEAQQAKRVQVEAAANKYASENYIYPQPQQYPSLVLDSQRQEQRAKEEQEKQARQEAVKERRKQRRQAESEKESNVNELQNALETFATSISGLFKRMPIEAFDKLPGDFVTTEVGKQEDRVYSGQLLVKLFQLLGELSEQLKATKEPEAVKDTIKELSQTLPKLMAEITPVSDDNTVIAFAKVINDLQAILGRVGKIDTGAPVTPDTDTGVANQIFKETVTEIASVIKALQSLEVEEGSAKEKEYQLESLTELLKLAALQGDDSVDLKLDLFEISQGIIKEAQYFVDNTKPPQTVTLKPEQIQTPEGDKAREAAGISIFQRLTDELISFIEARASGIENSQFYVDVLRELQKGENANRLAGTEEEREPLIDSTLKILAAVREDIESLSEGRASSKQLDEFFQLESLLRALVNLIEIPAKNYPDYVADPVSQGGRPTLITPAPGRPGQRQPAPKEQEPPERKVKVNERKFRRRVVKPLSKLEEQIETFAEAFGLNADKIINDALGNLFEKLKAGENFDTALQEVINGIKDLGKEASQAAADRGDDPQVSQQAMAPLIAAVEKLGEQFKTKGTGVTVTETQPARTEDTEASQTETPERQVTVNPERFKEAVVNPLDMLRESIGQYEIAFDVDASGIYEQLNELQERLSQGLDVSDLVQNLVESLGGLADGANAAGHEAEIANAAIQGVIVPLLDFITEISQVEFDIGVNVEGADIERPSAVVPRPVPRSATAGAGGGSGGGSGGSGGRRGSGGSGGDDDDDDDEETADGFGAGKFALERLLDTLDEVNSEIAGLIRNTVDWVSELREGDGIIANIKKFVVPIGFTALVGIFATMAVFATETFNAIQKLKQTMTALQIRGIDAAVESVKELSIETGVATAQLAEQLGKFQAATTRTSLEPEAPRIYESVLNYGVSIGSTEDELNRGLVALEQMAAKGRVSLEELNGQLSEAMPGASNLAAASLNITKDEMFAMAEAGDLLAKDLLPAMATTLNRIATASEGIEVKVLSREFGKLVNALKLISLAATGDLLEGVTESLSMFSTMLGDATQLEVFGSQLQSLAKAVGLLLVLFGTKGLTAALYNMIKATEIATYLGAKHAAIKALEAGNTRRAAAANALATRSLNKMGTALKGMAATYLPLLALTAAMYAFNELTKTPLELKADFEEIEKATKLIENLASKLNDLSDTEAKLPSFVNKQDPTEITQEQVNDILTREKVDKLPFFGRKEQIREIAERNVLPGQKVDELAKRIGKTDLAEDSRELLAKSASFGRDYGSLALTLTDKLGITDEVLQPKTTPEESRFLDNLETKRDDLIDNVIKLSEAFLIASEDIEKRKAIQEAEAAQLELTTKVAFLEGALNTLAGKSPETSPVVQMYTEELGITGSTAGEIRKEASVLLAQARGETEKAITAAFQSGIEGINAALEENKKLANEQKTRVSDLQIQRQVALERGDTGSVAKFDEELLTAQNKLDGLNTAIENLQETSANYNETLNNSLGDLRRLNAAFTSMETKFLERASIVETSSSINKRESLRISKAAGFKDVGAFEARSQSIDVQRLQRLLAEQSKQMAEAQALSQKLDPTFLKEFAKTAQASGVDGVSETGIDFSKISRTFLSQFFEGYSEESKLGEELAESIKSIITQIDNVIGIDALPTEYLQNQIELLEMERDYAQEVNDLKRELEATIKGLFSEFKDLLESTARSIEDAKLELGKAKLNLDRAFLEENQEKRKTPFQSSFRSDILSLIAEYETSVLDEAEEALTFEEQRIQINRDFEDLMSSIQDAFSSFKDELREVAKTLAKINTPFGDSDWQPKLYDTLESLIDKIGLPSPVPQGIATQELPPPPTPQKVRVEQSVTPTPTEPAKEVFESVSIDISALTDLPIPEKIEDQYDLEGILGDNPPAPTPEPVKITKPVVTPEPVAPPVPVVAPTPAPISPPKPEIPTHPALRKDEIVIPEPTLTEKMGNILFGKEEEKYSLTEDIENTGKQFKEDAVTMGQEVKKVLDDSKTWLKELIFGKPKEPKEPTLNEIMFGTDNPQFDSQGNLIKDEAEVQQPESEKRPLRKPLPEVKKPTPKEEDSPDKLDKLSTVIKEVTSTIKDKATDFYNELTYEEPTLSQRGYTVDPDTGIVPVPLVQEIMPSLEIPEDFKFVPKGEYKESFWFPEELNEQDNRSRLEGEIIQQYGDYHLEKRRRERQEKINQARSVTPAFGQNITPFLQAIVQGISIITQRFAQLIACCEKTGSISGSNPNVQKALSNTGKEGKSAQARAIEEQNRRLKAANFKLTQEQQAGVDSGKYVKSDISGDRGYIIQDSSSLKSDQAQAGQVKTEISGGRGYIIQDISSLKEDYQEALKNALPTPDQVQSAFSFKPAFDINDLEKTETHNFVEELIPNEDRIEDVNLDQGEAIVEQLEKNASTIKRLAEETRDIEKQAAQIKRQAAEYARDLKLEELMLVAPSRLREEQFEIKRAIQVLNPSNEIGQEIAGYDAAKAERDSLMFIEKQLKMLETMKGAKSEDDRMSALAGYYNISELEEKGVEMLKQLLKVYDSTIMAEEEAMKVAQEKGKELVRQTEEMGKALEAHVQAFESTFGRALADIDLDLGHGYNTKEQNNKLNRRKLEAELVRDREQKVQAEQNRLVKYEGFSDPAAARERAEAIIAEEEAKIIENFETTVDNWTNFFKGQLGDLAAQVVQIDILAAVRGEEGQSIGDQLMNIVIGQLEAIQARLAEYVSEWIQNILWGRKEKNNVSSLGEQIGEQTGKEAIEGYQEGMNSAIQENQENSVESTSASQGSKGGLGNIAGYAGGAGMAVAGAATGRGEMIGAGLGMIAGTAFGGAAGGMVGSAIGGIIGGLFAKGGEVGDQGFDPMTYQQAFDKERAISGKKPILGMLHEGEEVLSTINGDAQAFRSVRDSGIWDTLKDNAFAFGGTVGGKGGTASSMINNNSTNNTGGNVTNNQSYVFNIKAESDDIVKRTSRQIEDRKRRLFL